MIAWWAMRLAIFAFIIWCIVTTVLGELPPWW
jgi:hypothetical protein